MQNIDFQLRGEFIPLDALLKATGLAPSGGFAKGMVADGKVQVNGQMELRKTCKVRAGQVVSVASVRVRVQAAPSADASPAPGLGPGPAPAELQQRSVDLY